MIIFSNSLIHHVAAPGASSSPPFRGVSQSQPLLWLPQNNCRIRLLRSVSGTCAASSFSWWVTTEDKQRQPGGAVLYKDNAASDRPRFQSLFHGFLALQLWLRKKVCTEPDMILKCLWLIVLMGLCIMGILSLDCNLLNVRLRRVTLQNLRLLSSLSNSFPVECLKENKDFELPQKILSHTQTVKRDLKEAFYEVSTQAFHIFSQYTFKPIWKQKHLNQIQIGLDKQLEYLEQCLPEEENENGDAKEVAMKHSGAQGSQVHNLELRRYFNKIYNFLKEKKYSHCAQDIVQVEIRRCIYYFYQFTALLRRK
ncbi:interferon kappa [Nycticebus coucang]|uniref:interferon kappa n=1 Tax=Nycticebus coucang TaxID=9470 RepID=UPI00234CDFE5|nr:interferon kappa [Nycticebus coucang]